MEFHRSRNGAQLIRHGARNRARPSRKLRFGCVVEAGNAGELGEPDEPSASLRRALAGAFYVRSNGVTASVEFDKTRYPWPVAEVEADVLKRLRVLRQSTKIVLDRDGVITYRAGYADGGPDAWRGVFERLVASPTS